MFDEPHHADVLRDGSLEEGEFQVAVGVGHPGQEDAVVVFGLGQAVNVVTGFDPGDGAVGGEVYYPVPQEFTVR